jgi:hypothetical protein
MSLPELVDTYLAVAGGYGVPVALSALGYPSEDLERTLTALDEDYHIGRYLHFQCAAGANYRIGGFPQTHLAIDAGIQSAL